MASQASCPSPRRRPRTSRPHSRGEEAAAGTDEPEARALVKVERLVESPTGQISPFAHKTTTCANAGQAARRSYRWCRPPTFGSATILPMLGGWTALGSGASLLGTRAGITVPIWPPIHPGWLRCAPSVVPPVRLRSRALPAGRLVGHLVPNLRGAVLRTRAGITVPIWPPIWEPSTRFRPSTTTPACGSRSIRLGGRPICTPSSFRRKRPELGGRYPSPTTTVSRAWCWGFSGMSTK